MNALDRIIAERQRQISVEGWNQAHDDAHTGGELATAAFLYLSHGTVHDTVLRADGAPKGWPWERDWWKPRDRLRNLERAGALFLAEIERRKRASLPAQSIEHALSITLNRLEDVLKQEG
ncbi:hypothetical protein [Ruegeria sp. TM1040]|uniref:hypothetical protein n=1 Tax=Ruegeria sp. (strain TM1040) TaxID=292414 RepID=UPI0000462381|nr:hypothetical protein [Ruegeria sp. TM1040]